MHILYDGYIYAAQTAGGINRYFSQVISKLPKNFSPTLSASRTKSIDAPNHPNLRLVRYKGFRPGRISLQFEKYFFRLKVDTSKFDLIHPTYYSLLSQKNLSDLRAPIVLTVWDMIHEIFSEKIDPTGQEAEKKRQAILAAQAIICISEKTKQDLLERYPLAEDKVRVIYLGPGVDISQADSACSTPSRPYYLYVGARYAAYKNFDGLLNSFAKAVMSFPDIQLYVVGAPFSNEEHRFISGLKLDRNVKHAGYMNDKCLATLYRNSISLVYPSLYEGFGIPPLEAMACGTTVIASNSSSIPEVVGDAGLLFDPNSKDDLTDALLFLLKYPSARQNLLQKGEERAKLFSWEKTVAQTVNVYKTVVGNRTAGHPA